MGAPKRHENYGKRVLHQAFGDAFNPKAETYKFGSNAGTAKIDGKIDKTIAVEIESRQSKQVCGALIHLAFHPFNRKLLILIRVFSNEYTAHQCKIILQKICKRSHRFKVIVLQGNGKNKNFKQDVKLVQKAVRFLKKK